MQNIIQHFLLLCQDLRRHQAPSAVPLASCNVGVHATRPGAAVWNNTIGLLYRHRGGFIDRVQLDVCTALCPIRSVPACGKAMWFQKASAEAWRRPHLHHPRRETFNLPSACITKVARRLPARASCRQRMLTTMSLGMRLCSRSTSCLAVPICWTDPHASGRVIYAPRHACSARGWRHCTARAHLRAVRRPPHGRHRESLCLGSNGLLINPSYSSLHIEAAPDSHSLQPVARPSARGAALGARAPCRCCKKSRRLRMRSVRHLWGREREITRASTRKRPQKPAANDTRTARHSC